MKNKSYILCIVILLLSTLTVSCSFTHENDNSINNSDYLSIDFSRVITSLPGHDSNVYAVPEELLGVTEDQNKLVGKYKKENLKEKYETLATDVYTMYSFEHEDGTASQMYKYYFFDTKEAYDQAYESFSLKNGSPSIRNEQSLFFGHGGSAELYISGRPKFDDIAIYFQSNSIEIIREWGSSTSETPND